MDKQECKVEEMFTYGWHLRHDNGVDVIMSDGTSFIRVDANGGVTVE